MVRQKTMVGRQVLAGDYVEITSRGRRPQGTPETLFGAVSRRGMSVTTCNPVEFDVLARESLVAVNDSTEIGWNQTDSIEAKA